MSQVEVDKIIPQSGTTLTIGDSGDTITIASGATLSGSLNADNLDSGTVPTARVSGAYTGITQTGTLTSFASTGIDDNATSTAITINSSQNVGIGVAVPSSQFTVGSGGTDNPTSIVQIHSSTHDKYFLKLTSSGFNTASDWIGLGIGYSDNYLKSAIIGEAQDGFARTKLHFCSNSSTSSANASISDKRMSIDYNGDISFYEGTGTTPLLFWDASSARLGIGTTSPATRLHSALGSSGATANNYSTAILEANNPFNVLQFLSPNTDVQQIRFGDPESNGAGVIHYSHSSDFMTFYTVGTERMIITSLGRVGIGTSYPSLPLEVSGSGLFGGSVIATGSTTTTSDRRAIMTHDGTSMKLLASGDSTHRNMIFYRDGGDDEAMRIDTSNRLMIGAANSLFNAQLTVNSGSSLRAQDGYNGNPPVRIYMGTDFTGGLFIEFTASDGTRIGSITRASSTSIAFNTTSDYRLKENVSYDFDATTRLKQLNLQDLTL